MRLARTHILVLLGLGFIIGSAITAFVLLNSPSREQAALETLERNFAKVQSEVANDISPQRPLVIAMELFQRGGYKAGFDDDWDHMYIYGERVTSKLVITPDADGRAVRITEEISNLDGSAPIVENLLDGTRTIGPVGNTDTSDSGVQEPWDVAGWLNAQSRLPREIQKRGYVYAGRFELDGQPSIWYELGEATSSFPAGQKFEPLFSQIEFVEANPLLGRESHYRVMKDGTLVLDYEQKTKSLSAGEPADDSETPRLSPDDP